MKIKKSKNGEWGFDFTCKGQRVRKIVGLSKQETEQVMWAEYRQIKRDGFGLKEAPKNIDFGDFAKEFLEIYSKQNKRSWKRDRTSIKSLAAAFKGKYLSTISPDMIERYKAARKGAVSAASINRELSCLKTIYSKANEWGKVEANPAKGIKKLREKNGRERILNEEEIVRLVDMAASHLKPILIVLLSTGMRRTEVLSLKWQNVNFNGGYIYIEDSKSGKSRNVPMNVIVTDTLDKLPRESEFVFFNRETNTCMKDIKNGFGIACKKAKIVGLRLHDLRHTAASTMVRKGIDLVTVSKILGHSSILMTMRYSYPTPENFKRAVECLGEVFQKKPEYPGENPVNPEIDAPASHSMYAN